MTDKRIPTQEHLVVALLLAWVGGFLDIYTYLLHGGVFANAQTGNLVFFGFYLAKGQMREAFWRLLPVFSFAMGVCISELLDQKFHRMGRFRWRQIVLLVEILLLFLIGIGVERQSSFLVTVIVSFICAMQVGSFKKICGANFASTMCTGNLRSAMECLTRYGIHRQEKDIKHFFHYVLVIITFCAGVTMGYFLVGYFDIASVWVCCILLFINFLYLHLRNDIKEGKSLYF